MNALKLVSLGLVLFSLSLFSSCEQESLSPEKVATDVPALEKAIVHHADGSYTYEFTGEQIIDYVSRHYDKDIPTDSREIFAVFGELLAENEEGPAGSAKMTSFSFRYRVETILAPGDPISDWIITGGGGGGVFPGLTPDFSFVTRQARLQSSFFIMAAFVDANTNTGASVFSDSDSSADVGVCVGNKFGPRGIIGTARINWNSLTGTFSGDADVRCGPLLVVAEEDVVICC